MGIHSLFFLAAAVLCTPARAAAQLDVVWQGTFSGDGAPSSQLFEVESSVLGLRDGGLLIASSEHDGIVTTRHLVRRFTANGAPAWTTELPVPFPGLPATASEGIISMEDSPSGDLLCRRVTRSGFQGSEADWWTQWIGADGAVLGVVPGGGLVRPTPDGGHLQAQEFGAFFIPSTLKRFRRDGTLVWERQLDGRITSLEVDPFGNSYVFGRNEDIMYTAIPMMAGRVSYAGDVASTTCIFTNCAHSGPAWFQDEDQWNLFGSNAARLGLDDRGHVQFAASDGSTGWLAYSFDRAGGLSWSYSTQGTGVDEALFRNFSGADGSVWLVGSTTLPTGVSATFVRRLDPDGTPMWTSYEPLPAFELHDVVLDRSGRLFMTLEDASAGATTIRLVAFGPDGTRLGSYDAGVPVPSHHSFRRRSSLAVDELGGVILAQSQVTGAGLYDVQTLVTRLAIGGDQGSVTCAQSTPNSSGATGALRALGAAARSSNDLMLVASDLPPASTGLFLTATGPGLIVNPGGSAGDLCLGPGLGRYVRANEVTASDPSGRLLLRLDLDSTPGPFGAVNVLAGETRYFQVWHRDIVPSVSYSNFTDAIAVTLH